MTFEQWITKEFEDGGSIQDDILSGEYRKSRDILGLLEEAYEDGKKQGYTEGYAWAAYYYHPCSDTKF